MKTILLNLDDDLYEEMGSVAQELHKTKTAFARQAIVRNIEFANKHEIPIVRRLAQAKFGAWN